MADQYATPSAPPSCVSNNDDDDDVSNMDTDDEGCFGDDGRFGDDDGCFGDDDGCFGDDESTLGRSCQNEGGLQKYTSPQETSPDCETHETQEEDMYQDKNHQDPFPGTPQATADIDDIDDNFESTLGGLVKSLNDEQALLNERQANVHTGAREIVAGAAKHTFQTLLPQLEKMKHRLKTSHQLLKELPSPPTNNAVPRARASQPPPEQGIEKDALERRLEGALQALDNACKALHGMETPAHDAASYQEQNNALTVPLSACPDDAAIGNGRTNNSGLTGKINAYHFDDTDIGITQAGAGNNNMHQFSDFLHLPIASDGNGNMTSNAGQLHSPPLLGWGNQPATYAFCHVGNASC